MLYVRPLLNRVEAILDRVATVQRPFRDRVATSNDRVATVQRPCLDSLLDDLLIWLNMFLICFIDCLTHSDE